MKKNMLNHNHDLSTKLAIILGISKIAIGLFILFASIMYYVTSNGIPTTFIK